MFAAFPNVQWCVPWWVCKISVIYVSFCSSMAVVVAPPVGGGERLFSHSFMKSEADFLMLPGVRRLRAAGHVSSLSMFGDDGCSRDNSFLLYGRAAVSGRIKEAPGVVSQLGPVVDLLRAGRAISYRCRPAPAVRLHRGAVPAGPVLILIGVDD